MIRVPSVKSEALPGKPFGEGPANALHAFLEYAEKLGFHTENFDNYAGHIDMGEGEETLGILAHVDVVPVGEGWTYPPFRDRKSTRLNSSHANISYAVFCLKK